MPFDADVVLALDEPLLSVEHAAALLRVRPSWVRDAVRAGRLPCIHVGRDLRFERLALVRWAALNPIEDVAIIETRGDKYRID
jgi:excisionase family DNA binding protein